MIEERPAGSARVLIRRLSDEVGIPVYARPGDAGADLTSVTEVTIAPGERALIPTGIAIALPPGLAAFVHPRSGLALRHGISIVNAPGTIDAGYRGEIKVVLVNTDLREPFTVRPGDRIAQLVIQPVITADFEEVDELPESERGQGGYGSSGGHASLDGATERNT